MGSKDWKTSNDKQLVIIEQLLIENRPIRFHELWAKCAPQLSKASFVKALRDLEKEGAIYRNKTSRKHVDFEFNPNHPEIKELLSHAERSLAWTEQLCDQVQKTLKHFDEILNEVSKRQRKSAIRALVHVHLALFTHLITDETCLDAKVAAEFGEFRFMAALSAKRIERLRLIQKQALIELLKIGEPTARIALEQLLKNNQRSMANTVKTFWNRYPKVVDVWASPSPNYAEIIKIIRQLPP